MILKLKPAANLLHNGYHKTDEFKRASAAAHTGKVVSAETRAKISASMLGRAPHNKGRPTSQEQKDKMSASARGRRGVIDTTTGALYRSIREASRQTGMSRKTIKARLASGTGFCYG